MEIDIEFPGLNEGEVVMHCPYETAWLDSNSVIMKLDGSDYIRYFHEKFAKAAGKWYADNKEIFQVKLKNGLSVFVSFFDGRMAIALGMWPRNQSDEKRFRHAPFEVKQ